MSATLVPCDVWFLGEVSSSNRLVRVLTVLAYQGIRDAVTKVYQLEFGLMFALKAESAMDGQYSASRRSSTYGRRLPLPLLTFIVFCLSSTYHSDN